MHWATLAIEVSYQNSHVVQLCVLLWRGVQELPPDCLTACIAQKVHQHRVHAQGQRAACIAKCFEVVTNKLLSSGWLQSLAWGACRVVTEL